MKREKTKSRLAASSATLSKRFSPKLAWAILALVIVFFGGIRIRLLDIPLERDEGEYAYAGQLILQGIPPYKLAYNMKLPGTYAAYAAIMAAFGETTRGIHLGAMLVNAVTCLLVFLLAKKLFEAKTAVVAAASYGLLSASSSVLGLAAHANHFVILCVMAGILVQLQARESGKARHFFASGLLLGLGFIMKQQGVLFCLFGGLWLMLSEWLVKPVDWNRLLMRCGLMTLGGISPFLLTCSVLWLAGVFPKFWFWTFAYARAYATTMPISVAPDILKQILPIIFDTNQFLWILGGVGLILLGLAKENRARSLWLLGFVLFSGLAVCPGYYFRQQYFILLLPALALLTGAAVQIGSSFLSKWKMPPFVTRLPMLIFVLGFTWGIYQQRAIFFQVRPIDASVMNYSENPFLESVEIASYIQAHTNPDAKIAVVGSEPQIYFYARRHSATGYIYTYPLMEEQPYAKTMQQEMIQEIETNRPEYIVMVGFPFSWVVRPKSDQTIFHWFDDYKTNYVSVGVGDYLSPEERDLRWDTDQDGQTRTKFYVQIWRRRDLPEFSTASGG